MPFQHSRPTYTFKQFLETCNLGKNSGLDEIKSGRLQVIRIGRRRKKILITATAIDHWLSAKEAEER